MIVKSESPVVSRHLSICNQQGLHLRPCHLLVSLAAEFEGDIRVTCHGREVNGKSILSLMTLTADCGDTLVFTVRGEGAETWLDRVEDVIQNGFGETI